MQSAKFVGLDTFFVAAQTAARASCTYLEACPGQPLVECCMITSEQALRLALEYASSFATLLSDGAHLAWLTSEAQFTKLFCERLLPCLKPELPSCARVLAAWRDLERSGLRNLRGREEIYELSDRITEMHLIAQAAKDARVPLRSCALPACGACEAHVAHFKKCGACGQVVYCS